ncbi:TIGR02186 family protein [Fulvimarina sp. 2208YS6-2-32]|uniref:TIGR02186 family protein n=1 Tax=Fulvimarina uroteuthidis TaxID=3098149 RepID=A0ABU5I5Y1_9HYPH|nr:TIGR02186 family protein [Fulvimarina sp. 2208YS6-2-32]MDY8109566.1 TIGR02186 family protein [Fulvimarina sp. 2208YS6-2-32]
MNGRLPRSRHTISKALSIALLAMIGFMGSRGHAQLSEVGQRESFEIGLSQTQIGITSDFNGETITVFGAIGDADMRILREQRYDVVIALFGPLRPVVVREKQRFFGVWVNRVSKTIPAAPVTYSVASTRELRDIAPAETLRRLSLGIDTLRLDGRTPRLGQPRPVSSQQARFENALRDLKSSRGLYTVDISGVDYTAAESTLFRADLFLPADLSTGEHVVRAYLFKQGKIIGQKRADLIVRKVGFEAEIDRFASEHGFLYGLFAVALAIVTGWLGRVMFKRD